MFTNVTFTIALVTVGFIGCGMSIITLFTSATSISKVILLVGSILIFLCVAAMGIAGLAERSKVVTDRYIIEPVRTSP